MKSIVTFFSCLIGLCPQVEEAPPVVPQYNTVTYKAVEYDRSTLAGNYLASRFAQRNHDWKRATTHIDGVLEHAPDDLSLKKRSMVLGMGAGKHDLAIRRAAEVLAEEPNNALALLFEAMAAFKAQDYKTAAAMIAAMPDGSLSEFIMPLLRSWSQAAIGVNDTQGLQGSTIHIYHAILIADYLGQHDHVQDLLSQSLNVTDISTADLSRIADIYGHIGEREKAAEIYSKIQALEPDSKDIAIKIERLRGDGDVSLFKMVNSPEAGLAETMFDMARILYSDYSDESARIFANIALYLNPELSDVKILLAYISARNERYADAIRYYDKIDADDDHYFEARRSAANLLEEDEQIEAALAALNDLVETHDDLDALIQIGDVYRRNSQFDKAIETYDAAEAKLGGSIPAKYWHIHYVRGITHEEIGNWTQAEKDLQNALRFEPDNPVVLNYLGYSWADQGVNLQQSLEMIKKAAALRPEDGYIIDSLGWVLYRMGQYDKAIEPLERAVELLPYDPIINDHLGDAYWQVGRKLEARFQWARAKNHTEDEDLIATIAEKMENGLSDPAVTKAVNAEQAK